MSRLQRTARRKSIDGGNANDAEMSMLVELGKGKGKKSKAAMQARWDKGGGGGDMLVCCLLIVDYLTNDR